MRGSDIIRHKILLIKSSQHARATLGQSGLSLTDVTPYWDQVADGSRLSIDLSALERSGHSRSSGDSCS
jgi:hypothetical protein